MSKSKKKIRPHKGGRTDNLFIRLTKDERALFDSVRGNLSYADYFVLKASEDHKKNK